MAKKKRIVLKNEITLLEFPKEIKKMTNTQLFITFFLQNKDKSFQSQEAVAQCLNETLKPTTKKRQSDFAKFFSKAKSVTYILKNEKIKIRRIAGEYTLINNTENIDNVLLPLCDKYIFTSESVHIISDNTYIYKIVEEEASLLVETLQNVFPDNMIFDIFTLQNKLIILVKKNFNVNKTYGDLLLNLPARIAEIQSKQIPKSKTQK